MIDLRLFILQRVSALIMVPLILGHLGIIIFAIEGGLSADEILSRTRGSLFWGAYYSVFVLAVSLHGAIGFRAILSEWASVGEKTLTLVFWVVLLGLLGLGLRAVWAVVT